MMLSPASLVAAILAARGISKYRLAEACGVPRQTINGILRGEHRLTAAMALLIAKALRISELELLNLQRDADMAKARRQMKRRLAKVKVL